MNDTRTAKAIFLSIIVIFIYTQLVMTPPKPHQPPAAKPTMTPSISGSNPVGAPTAAPPEMLPSAEDYKSSETFTIETDRVLFRISKLGGRVLSYKLKQHSTSMENKEPLDMVVAGKNYYPLAVKSGVFSDAPVAYKLEGATAGTQTVPGTFVAPPGGKVSLLLTGTLPNGSQIKKQLSIANGTYLLDVDATITPASTDGAPLALEWSTYLPADHLGERWNLKQFVVLDERSKIVRHQPADVVETEVTSLVKWVGINDNYFSTTLIPLSDVGSASVRRHEDMFFVSLYGNSSRVAATLYIGPESQTDLKLSGHELSRGVDLGWFAFIGQPINIMIEFLFRLMGNYGLAIVCLTLLLKAVLLPLAVTSYRSMKSMQDLQPEMKALRERVKDPTQLNQEMMALYKRRGVNPMGGCLPIVIQIPIFLGMYNALRTSVDLRHAPFALWIQDLSAPERFDILGVHVPVMILIMGISMYAQQLTAPKPSDPMQRRMMYIMPGVITLSFIAFPFPAGLVLYWLTNNLISIAQQMALRKEEGLSPFRATILGSLVIFGFAFLLTLL